MGVMCGPGCLLAEVMVRMSGSLVMELHLATSDSDDDDDVGGDDDVGVTTMMVSLFITPSFMPRSGEASRSTR